MTYWELNLGEPHEGKCPIHCTLDLILNLILQVSEKKSPNFFFKKPNQLVLKKQLVIFFDDVEKTSLSPDTLQNATMAQNLTVQKCTKVERIGPEGQHRGRAFVLHAADHGWTWV